MTNTIDIVRGSIVTITFVTPGKIASPITVITLPFNWLFTSQVGGMYRGSSFLLRHAFTVHRGVIDLIAQPRFTSLWETDFGANETDCELIPTIRELIDGIKESYRPFAPASGSAQPTDTLVTKIVLGTFGCLPACDRYFIDGFKSEGFKYSRLDGGFIVCLRNYCRANLIELERNKPLSKSVVGCVILL